jgi:hypothetical protein
MWNQSEGIALCRALENIAPQFGCHVALTGGLLYKDGPRKDADVMLYRIRQVEAIDMGGMEVEMLKLGITINEDAMPYGVAGWVRKGKYQGKRIDFFFPDAPSTFVEAEKVEEFVSVAELP